MQHVEELFARELNAIEVRAVYPEYGFTETMSEHISTSAYATVASLLVYGAERGSCNIAERVQRENSQGEESRHKEQPTERTRPSIGSVQQETDTEKRVEDVDKDEDGEDIGDIDFPDDEPRKGGWKRGLRRFVDKMTTSFTGSNDELEF